jgi:RHS repeat-associated protein
MSLPFALTHHSKRPGPHIKNCGLDPWNAGLLAWTHTYNVYFIYRPEGADADSGRGDPGPSWDVHWGDGSVEGWGWPGVHLDLRGNDDRFVTKDQTTYVFGRMEVDQVHNRLVYWLTAIIDRNGNTITVTRDATDAWKVLSVTDSAGRQLTFQYDGNRLVSVRDPLYNASYPDYHRWLFVNDANGYLAQVQMPRVTVGTTPQDYSVGFTTANGRLSAYTDERGKTWTFDYNAAITGAHDYAEGAVGTATQPATGGSPVIWTFAYDWSSTSQAVTTVTDPNGRQTVYAYDAMLGWMSNYYSHRTLHTVTLPSLGGTNNPVEFWYDADRNVSRVDDQNDATWLYTSSTGFADNTRNGNLLTATDPTGHTVTNTYTDKNDLDTVDNPIVDGNPDPQRIVTDNGYDAYGNLTSTTDALNHAWTYEVDAFGQRTAAVSPVFNPQYPAGYARTEYVYDGDTGDLLTTKVVLDPNDRTKDLVTTNTYDGLGRKLTETVGTTADRSWQQTTYTRDEWGRVVFTTVSGLNADGTTLTVQTSSTTYDGAGNVLSVTDGNGHTSYKTYDNAGRILTEQNGRGDTVTSHYDGTGQLGLLSYVTDGNGHDTHFTYDARNRKTRTDYADGTFETSTLDAVGNVLTHTDANGTVLGYEYDPAYRLLLKKKWIPGSPGSWQSLAQTTYDFAGRRLTLTDHYDTGTRTTTWGLKLNDLVETLTTPDATLTYTYDNANRRTLVTKTGTGFWQTVYDRAGRVTSVTNPSNETTTFTYNRSSLPTAQQMANNMVTTLAYDGLHRVRDVWHGAVTTCAGGSPPENPEFIEEPALDAATQDGVGMAALGPGGPPPAPGPSVAVLHYEYDGASNVIQRDECKPWMGRFTTYYSYDNANQVTRELQYDAYSNTLDTAYTYDNNSNRLTKTVNGVTDTYVYVANSDQLDRITRGGVNQKVYTYDDNGNCRTVWTSAGTTTLTYDVDDRVKTIVYPNNTSTEFLYNGLGLRFRKTDKNAQGGITKTVVEVTDGADVASPLLTDGTAVYTPGISERTGSTTTYYHMDAQGSVIATTTANQTQTGDMRYDAFGQKSWYVNSVTTFSWNAKSQYRTDVESGLMLLGHRYYDCATGRFISQDPDQDGWNWYAYCGNNPLGGVDPTGLTRPKAADSEDAEFRAEVEKAVKSLEDLPSGKPLVDDAMKSKDDYIVYRSTVPNDTATDTGELNKNGGHIWRIEWDSRISAPVLVQDEGTGKYARGKTGGLSLLAHELGHAVFGTKDDGPGRLNNTNRAENPVRHDLHLPLRRSYEWLTVRSWEQWKRAHPGQF